MQADLKGNCAIERALDFTLNSPLNHAIPSNPPATGIHQVSLQPPPSAANGLTQGPQTRVVTMGRTASDCFRDRRIRPLCHPSAVVQEYLSGRSGRYAWHAFPSVA